jgi:hypothetical protein
MMLANWRGRVPDLASLMCDVPVGKAGPLEHQGVRARRKILEVAIGRVAMNRERQQRECAQRKCRSPWLRWRWEGSLVGNLGLGACGETLL